MQSHTVLSQYNIDSSHSHTLTMAQPGLVERLANGGDVVVAEGYLFEFERRGYLKAGGYVPEVVIEHPNLVKNLHEEFVHAGSDVVLAFTYYGHREKMCFIGKEDLLETLNANALKIARAVADDTGTLMAGNICNSTIYQKDSQDSKEKAEAMFKGPIAALPVTYRTTKEYPSMQMIKDPDTGKRAFPENLSAQFCSGNQILEFAQAAKELGVQYVGLCCGNCASFTRIVAETYGRRPPASKYSPDMSQHYTFSNKSSFSNYYQSGVRKLVGGDSE